MKLFLASLLLSSFALANTPGKHSVVLTWTASTTAGVTYNIYRGTSTGVCSGTPTPYATNISGTTFTDNNVTLGTTYFYNVSAFSATGGESTCDGEVQIAVPNITTNPATNLSGAVQ